MNKAIIIFLLILSYNLSGSDKIYDIDILSNYDTLLIHKTPGKIILGTSANYSIISNTGKILIPQYPDVSLSNTNQLRDFLPDAGYGYQIQLFGQYRMYRNLYFAIGISPLTYFNVRYELSDEYVFDNKKNKVNTNTYYFSLSPHIHYDLVDYDIGFSLGIDYSLLIKSQTLYTTYFTNTADISIEEDIELSPMKSLTGFFCRVKYDLIKANYNDNTRITASPYVSFAHSPNFFETYGTASANNSIRIGVSVSLGVDQISYDTLKYKKVEKELISRKSKGRISIPKNNIKSNDVDQIDKEIYEPDFAESTPIDRYKLDINTRDYLDYLIVMMKKNDRHKINIIANIASDNKKNLIDKEINAITKYLNKNGIKEDRIITTKKITEKNKSKVKINIIN